MGEGEGEKKYTATEAAILGELKGINEKLVGMARELKETKDENRADHKEIQAKLEAQGTAISGACNRITNLEEDQDDPDEGLAALRKRVNNIETLTTTIGQALTHEETGLSALHGRVKKIEVRSLLISGAAGAIGMVAGMTGSQGLATLAAMIAGQ
jgi:chromosome segregation ATPase